ncbi:hypothetical protein [Erwinia piriflorinigrans]|uniref:Lipoprotein n=1 Tax=Erwinia piriflorinigrans CFBP 5888 TaxID=1161919 RepID=V5ZC58_9GAMM|nr:hypothetical protein [Erwinia piriflorinigrans]CCG88865.1 hypothetical protein EPIR_3502 [Erwinia piriflorinigrans CFBP 5888]
MKKLMIIASLLVSQPLLAATPDYTRLEGTWQVDAVRVNDSPVQAVVVNDPQYMEAKVTFSADNIVWNTGTQQRPTEPTIDNCQQKPRLVPIRKSEAENGYQVANGFNILCGANPWGPGTGAVMTLSENGKMTLYWYDGAILSLKKVRESSR